MLDTIVLSEFLLFRVTSLAEGMSRSLSQRYREPYDVAVPEWRIMACLNQANMLTAGELRDRTCMEKPRVSRALTKMQPRDLIKKSSDLNDNRKINIQLTRGGPAMYRKIEPIAKQWECALVEELTQKEVQCVHSVLDKLSFKLTKLNEDKETIT